MQQWVEVSVQVIHGAVEAVADIFNTLRAGGVVIDDPLLLNHLLDSNTWEMCDIPKQENTEIVTITAYFPDDIELASRLNGLEEKIAEVESRIGPCRYGATKFRMVKEADWANEWKRFFHTTKVGKQLVIKPTWENYTPQGDEKVIVIDPGMAFGTGMHHTTNMCMKNLEELVKPGDTVFDIGCGSGILAMAASLLGAGDCKAVDIDLTAVKVAKENIALNNLSSKISVRQGDLLHGTEGKADIIIANIIADIIIMLLPDIPGKLKDKGVFLASGIIEARIEDVLAVAAQNGMKLLKIDRQGEWAAITMCREE
jgi:ribosomal protein L11 methyltransferase